MRGGGDACWTSDSRMTERVGKGASAAPKTGETCRSNLFRPAWSVLGRLAGLVGSASQQQEPGIRTASVQSREGVWQQDWPHLATWIGATWLPQQLWVWICWPHSQAWHWQASKNADAPSPCAASARAASQIKAVLRVRGRIMAIITTLSQRGKFSRYNPCGLKRDRIATISPLFPRNTP